MSAILASTPTPISLSTLVSLFSIGVGTYAVLAPRPYTQFFGFPPSSSAIRSAQSNPFIFVAGGRAIGPGLALLGLTYLGEVRAAGVVMASAGVVGLFDGLALVRFGDSYEGQAGGDDGKEKGVEKEERSRHAWKAAVGHWFATGMVAAYGVWVVMNC